jgi:farnesyl-diphosphate farnesyltransferase
MRETVLTGSGAADEAYQEHILPQVSRTFALTIPQLPAALRTVVTNAYLLCRIADTIEDESAASTAATLLFLQRFVAVVCDKEPPAPLAQELATQLAERTLPAERDLVLNMQRIINVTAQLDPRQRAAIQRCVTVMCGGMHQFQRTASLRGLARLSDLDDYCYYVAGVVGEMLTELFCSYSAAVAQRRDGLYQHAVSFAQGLQMTNILKDVWEDRRRGACWLPQEVFAGHGVDLLQLSAGQRDARFDAGLRELVGVAHAHLRDALAFTLLIPPQEAGIRRFCLWAIGLAVLTLRRIAGTPGFSSGAQVKVSHAAVAVTKILSNAAVRHDWALRFLFERAARGLPLAAAAVAGPTAAPTRQAPEPPTAAEPALEFVNSARRISPPGSGRRSIERSAL